MASVRAELNKKFIGSELILETHQPEISWLNEDAFSNILSILVTLEVSQKPISELKFALPENKFCILVTNVVHKLTLPLLAWPPIVELSTTVYVVPLITSVSPTVAPAQLHVPLLSKEIDEATLTLTVLWIEAVLPAASETEYVIVYTFGDWRYTACEVASLFVLSIYVIAIVIAEVRSPSKSSVAVAPRSVHWAAGPWSV